MDLSVIILNWNTRTLLEKCLESLFNQPREFEVEIIVVDNASEDGSREMVADSFPQAQLVVNSTKRQPSDPPGPQTPSAPLKRS